MLSFLDCCGLCSDKSPNSTPGESHQSQGNTNQTFPTQINSQPVNNQVHFRPEPVPPAQSGEFKVKFTTDIQLKII